jgi:hypothetical protein
VAALKSLRQEGTQAESPLADLALRLPAALGTL